MNEGSTVIEVAGVTKRFGKVTAVDTVNVALKEGEFFALLGPSGCGKTTLLRLIAGFETPDEGRILLDGKDITRLRANRRPVNLMFQSYELFPHMSVRANVAYGLEMDRLPRGEIRERVDDILRMTELVDLADRKPDQLSGGQRQRVMIAMALANEPDLLIADEPTTALDVTVQKQILKLIAEMQARHGTALLFVTHDLGVVAKICQNVSVLYGGKIVEDTDVKSLFARPAHPYTQALIAATPRYDRPDESLVPVPAAVIEATQYEIAAADDAWLGARQAGGRR